jgi:hypothetical protein
MLKFQGKVCRTHIYKQQPISYNIKDNLKKLLVVVELQGKKMFMKVLWKFDYKNIILNSKAKPSDKLE